MQIKEFRRTYPVAENAKNASCATSLFRVFPRKGARPAVVLVTELCESENPGPGVCECIKDVVATIRSFEQAPFEVWAHQNAKTFSKPGDAVPLITQPHFSRECMVNEDGTVSEEGRGFIEFEDAAKRLGLAYVELLKL
jgi:hypothetical protein